MRFVQFAVYCLEPEKQLGATEALRLSDPLMGIVNEKASSIMAFTDIMLCL